jgi:hypothetical protein
LPAQSLPLTVAVTVPSVRPLLREERVPLHVPLKETVVLQDELELDQLMSADEVPFRTASVAENISVVSSTMVVPAAGEMATAGDARSTVPFSHDIVPLLPSRSTILQPRVKDVVAPLVAGGTSAAPLECEVPAALPFQKHTACDAPIPPESTTLVRRTLPVGPRWRVEFRVVLEPVADSTGVDETEASIE